MDLEYKIRILTAKKAVVALDALANQFDNEEAKAQTKSLAWAVSWVIEELKKAHTDEAEIVLLKDALRKVRGYLQYIQGHGDCRPHNKEVHIATKKALEIIKLEDPEF